MIDRAAMKAVKSPGLIVLWIVFVVAFLLSAFLSYEDYLGSVAGYEMLPIQPITGYTSVAFGLLPQIGQAMLALFVVTAADLKARNTWVYFTLLLMFFLVDAGTDYLYLIGPNPTALGHITALAIAIFVYTLFSEWILMSSVALLIRTTPDALKAWVQFLGKLRDSFDSVIDLFQGESDETPEPRNRNTTVRQNEVAETRLPPRR